MLISTVVFLFFLFLIYALFLLSSRKSDARQVRMQKRVAEALQDFDSQEQQIESCRHWTS
jgi:Na+-transporting methylmalonyl-CoA/oxaloacetate decarboxylase gamma subunit